MSRVHAERPPAHRGPSKIPRFYQSSDVIPPVNMNYGGQGQPSKLQQLQSNYQQRLLKEKEEKLIRMYEDNQKRALQKVNSQQKMSMRDFFRERRQLEQTAENAHQLPSMNTHFKIKRMDGEVDDNWINRQNSNGSMKYGRGAPPARGRDKSNPLAPIDRNRGQGIPVPMKPQRHGRPLTYKESHTQDSISPKVHRGPKSAPTHTIHADENFPAFGKVTPSDDTPPPNLSNLKQRQKRHQHNSSKPSSGVSGKSKMSDFQKWQMEQDESREKRLAKAGVKAKPTYEYEESEEEGDDGEGGNSDVARQQQELMARIQEQQRELERMRKEREREEIQEKKDMERRKKREEERRRRLKEEEEERLREEAARRIREEEEAEFERKRLRAEQNVPTSHRGNYSASTNHRDDYSASANHRSDYSAPHSRATRNYSPEDDMMNYKFQPTPPPPKAKPVRVQRKAARPVPPPREPSPTLPAPSNQDLSFFLAAANDPEAHADSGVNLVACSNCGRKFASDRLQKHRNACGNLTKKRKVHDPSKMRVAGTDMEKYYSSSKRKKTPPPKKSNWRTKHESFINAIRYAKKVTEVEKTGGKVSDLPPPPASDTSDYVQCPWCSRKFNPGTAERHIPRCKDIKSRPAPPKKR